MDVTSLLNGESVAVEEKRIERPKIQGRSRTPWDAGGYALPITTRQPTSPPPQQQPSQAFYFDDEQLVSPTSPKHRFSDSLSSFSSLVSSIPSTTHSRFSSFSTVNSPHPLNAVAVDYLSPKSATMELTGSSNFPEGVTHELHTPSTPSAIHFDVLGPIAENRLSPPLEAQVQEEHDAKDTGRPGSPSDAILIKRTVVPTLRLDTSNHNIIRSAQHPPKTSRYLSAPLDQHHQTLINSNGHKRSASVPNFQNMNHSEGSVGPQGELTPPPSYHPDDASPMDYPAAADTPPSSTPGDDTIRCMYVVDCNTGSQLRKAISHIFGRNKMCTRMIPQNVWVHYCRKHYQRSRYRNPKEYAKLQCDLVQQQIRRVHEWSFNNAANGIPGVLQDWGLAVRKREQKRLDDMGGVKRKRAESSSNEHDADDGEDRDDDSGTARPLTAVPTWLLDLCGKGYSTHRIITIFNRLHNDIIADRIPCLPDIEILPNIYVKEDAKSLKTSPPKMASSHKRSQSLGGSAQYGQPSFGTRAGAELDYFHQGHPRQSSPWGSEESPFQKRRRPNETEDMSSRPSFGRQMQLPTRPALAAAGPQMDGRRFQFGEPPSLGSYRAPLPAPVPRRHDNPSAASHFESSYSNVARRPSHQRSRSDISAFTTGWPGYTAPSHSTNPVSAHPTDRPRPVLFEGQIGRTPAGFAMPQNEEYVAAQSGNGLQDANQRPRPGHSRHQSSPMGRGYNLPQGSTERPRSANITESVLARDVYRSRR